MLIFMKLFCTLYLASTAKGCFFSQRHHTLSHAPFPAENYKISLHIRKGHCAISFYYNLKSHKYNFSSYSREHDSFGKVQIKGRVEKEKQPPPPLISANQISVFSPKKAVTTTRLV